MCPLLSKKGVIGSAMLVVVSLNVCVCVYADSYGGLGTDSVLAPGWRFGVFLLMVIKKRGDLCLLPCLGVLSTVSCGSLKIGLKVAILKYPEIKERKETVFFLLHQRPLSLLCLAFKTHPNIPP